MYEEKISILLTVLLIASSVFTVEVMAYDENKSGCTESLSVKEIDDILKAAKVPEEKLAIMGDEEKAFIVQNSGTAIEYINVSECNSVEPLVDGIEISEEELEVTPTAFRTSDGKIDIYIVYEWKVPVKPIGKDAFAYMIYPDYYCVPNVHSNTIWAREKTTQSWQEGGSATYTGINFNGYEHKGVSLGTPDFPLYLKGVFYYQVETKEADPTNLFHVTYVHDTSTSSDFSYSLTIKEFGISFTPSSEYVSYFTKSYELDIIE